MPDRIDHAQLARVGVRMTDDQPMSVQTLMLAEAQVHATLALVEQQRVANLIAYLNIAEGVRGGRQDFDAGIAGLDEQVRSELGL